MPPSHAILAALLAAMLTSVALMKINQRVASPMLLVADRWLRWFVFSFGFAHLCLEYRLIDRPFWAVASAFFIVWFLIVSLYDWLAITAHSLSPLPVFPKYSVNSSGDEWPAQLRMLRIRDWLKSQGFRQVQALKADIGGGMFLRASIYQDSSATLRVQVSFIPQGHTAIATCCSISSITSEGERFLTDNLHIPFAGFYPENWFVERTPWRRSLSGLIRRHRRRMDVMGARPVPFTEDPLAELNAGQRELDQLNTELGFLRPHAEREDLGKFTQAGRYRVWKEIWTLNYLGRSARYE